MSNKRAGGRLERFKRKTKLFLSNPYTYIGIVILISIVACTYIIGVTETQTESGIRGWFDTVWQTLVIISAAYFDYYMLSVPGRMASLVLLLFGMIVFSFITGKITSGFMNILMKGNKGLRKLRAMKGHFIICGWRPGFDKILQTVMQSNPDIATDMIVLVNDAPPEQIERLKSDIHFKDVNYVAGDFSDAATLKRAYIESADRALVISDMSKGQSGMETDSLTVLAVLTMKNIKPSLYVAAELLDKKFEEHLQFAHCDEIILTQEYERSLLATASSGRGYSNVIKALISDDADSGIIIGEIPAAFVGKPYKELLDYAASKSDGILVGLLLNAGGTHQRKREIAREAQPGSELATAGSEPQNGGLPKSNRPVLTPADDFVVPKNAKSILVCANHR